jgi:hypothetical protein
MKKIRYVIFFTKKNANSKCCSKRHSPNVEIEKLQEEKEL